MLLEDGLLTGCGPDPRQTQQRKLLLAGQRAQHRVSGDEFAHSNVRGRPDFADWTNRTQILRRAIHRRRIDISADGRHFAVGLRDIETMHWMPPLGKRRLASGGVP